ncbi:MULTISPECIES: GGDEF domain-containing protein [Methylobacter]|jgi:diguanylate cyclase (GGDEF)-like protein|uniref:diguanylate cyclase n=1 Tax=Methylobacter tundripaludum (strain ATCC BAA-1195 / DSM 17260 / SV96) TaxID=697282 RepID=G3IR62_METTV|nr:GGDEF domain-containing protein [Methylobacter tundripaludum]EGW23709.1 diguanylate cyclase [Methylobacter tundripaludum SV96]
MNHKSANLAIISNNTFEATKAVNLDNYDISSALQTTLEFNELIAIFSSKIAHKIPHSAFIYTNTEFALEVKSGVFTRHSCNYALKVEQQQLGELKLMRNHRFSDGDLQLLETLLCCLIYPLKNATLFHQALKMAYTDPLTQTHNRASFNDTIKREMSLATRNVKNLSLIFFDIDHFKTINDTYGHDCGDITLALGAKWIKESLRDSDIIFRYGGEEFVILLSDTDANGAGLLAERIRTSIENHTIAYGMETIKITASLGVSTLRANDTIESFILRADKAMYAAKNKGRNQVVLAK